MTSPRFRKDPEHAARAVQVRFTNENQTNTVNRSHVGTTDCYATYEKIVKEEKDKKNKERMK